MGDEPTDPLASMLVNCDRVLEVGIGRRTGLAARLASRGIAVVAIDIEPVEAPPSVTVIRADVHTVDPARIGPVDAVFARWLPPELHDATWRLARRLAAPLYFTTLGGDPPTIPVSVHTGPRETVYVAGPGSNQV